MHKRDVIQFIWDKAVFFHKGDEQQQLLVVSNKVIEEQLVIEHWQLKAFLTAGEISYIEMKGQVVQRLAARIAAKLANINFDSKLEFHQISILPNARNKPFLFHKGKKVTDMEISLSHTEKYSGAIVRRLY